MHIRRQQKIAIGMVIYDLLSIGLSYFLTLLLRYDGNFHDIPAIYVDDYLKFTIGIYTGYSVLVYLYFKLYSSIWKFAGIHELWPCLGASAVTFPLHWLGMWLLFGHMPLYYYVYGSILQLLFLLVSRFGYRLLYLEIQKRDKQVINRDNVQRAMLIGAGEAGRVLLRELATTTLSNVKIVCIIDDDPNKQHLRLEGVPIVGTRDDILAVAASYKVKKILFAIPTATAEDRRDILNICKEADCELLALPGVYELANRKVAWAKMKEVVVEDLLGRKAIQVNNEEILEYLSSKVILVTGGGGSIGSELCRQIASHSPSQLIIFDVYENNAYEIEQELKRHKPDLNLTVLIGSVRDSRRINSVFETYHPEIVFHAAAHKHVPLMEGSPCEAIKNNVLGTYKTAYAAMTHGCKRFVLISTDKAVNPTNIMGASKRLCELEIQSLNKICHSDRYYSLPLINSHQLTEELSLLSPVGGKEGKTYFPTEFVAVRFGNVLESNGSVIPLFKKQIAEGGPVTVTHPDIIRYFMTIPEAVSLVLQASTYAKGGEIFILDMGTPVRIDTLARNLIKLCGYTPDVDIKIKYTGLRPGEKLYEEKLMDAEGLQKTANKLIHIAKPLDMDIEAFLKDLVRLAEKSYSNDKDIFQLVEQIVPTYRYSPNGNDTKPSVYQKQLALMKNN